MVQPMYYDHPDEPAAYACRNEFMFGTDLLVAPITSPADRETGLGRVRAWLPEGTWTDVFTGLTYTGGRTVLPAPRPDLDPGAGPGRRHRADGARRSTSATAPTCPRRSRCGCTPAPTATSRWSRTATTSGGRAPGSPGTTRPAKLTVHDVEGDADTLPADRTYRVVVVQPSGDVDDRVFALLDRAQMGYDLKATVYDAIRESDSPAAAVLALQGLDLSPVLLGALSELLLAR